MLGSARAAGLVCYALLMASCSGSSVRSCRTQLQPADTPLVTGVPAGAVRLGWQLAGARATRQSGYRLEISGGNGTLAWQSGWVSSDRQSVTVPARLADDASYRWRVEARLSDGSVTGWGCGPASFDTAPGPGQFPAAARWIGGGGQLRAKRGLMLPAGVIARARAYVSGVGAFYLFVNGRQVGPNLMDPPQTVYSKTVLYSSLDLGAFLIPGQLNHLGALLGLVKWGYTDLWCNLTAAGPDGCKALVLRVTVEMADGSIHVLDTSDPNDWQARQGPVLYDHFFHGESFDATVPFDWAADSALNADPAQAWRPAKLANPIATAPTGMQVVGPDGAAVALGTLKPTQSPPLRVTKRFAAQSVTQVLARDVGEAFVYDFGQNMAGMVNLLLPANHGIPAGTVLRIEHAEIVQGRSRDIDEMCKICPKCSSCSGGGGGASGPAGQGSCDSRGQGAVCDTYCHNPSQDKGSGQPDNHPLRHEPCFPHQSYSPGFPAGAPAAHDTPYTFIGDFNNANQTNLYTVAGDPAGEQYTAYFAAAGFRYAQLSGLPAGFKPGLLLLSALRVHSNVPVASNLTLPQLKGTHFGTPDVLQRIHEITTAAQSSNLWSIPTDCPQRERRGWMGDAQSTADEANMNFDMHAFYEEFLNKIRDDQARYNGNHPTDTGALADVVPYDGIGGNPGCPVWQVAYIVIARQLWKHYGEDALPSLKEHYPGLLGLLGWFDRHADPSDGLLTIACYGDWMGFKPSSGNGGGSPLTPAGSVSSFFHVLAVQYLSEIATALGNTADAQRFTQRFHRGQAAYHARYYNATVSGYSPCTDQCEGTSSRGSQTSNALALALGAPPTAEIRKAVQKSLVDDVVKFGRRATVGVTGMAYLFEALDAGGFSGTGIDVLLNDAYPSLGHMVHQNQTTLCENYANHIMLGGFDAWLLSSVGGLDSAVNGSTGGWRDVIARVAPGAITKLKSSTYVKRTRFGDVKLDWRFDQTSSKVLASLTLPIGSAGTFHAPMSLVREDGTRLQLQSLRESGVELWADRADRTLPAGVEAVRESQLDRELLTSVGSGGFRFEARYSM